MEGSCAKCRYAIYFTEKQAFEGAMVVCPKCGSGNIVLFNRESDNPRFIIKLGGNLGQKKRVKASLKSSSDVPDDFRLPGDGQSSGLQLETDVEPDYKDIGIRELIEQKIVPEYEGGESKADTQENAVFERSTQIRVSSYGDKKNISAIKLVFLLSILVVFVCGGYYVWQHRHEFQSYIGDYTAVDIGVEQGEQIVKAMQSRYPAVAENRLMYIKNGELAFSRDSFEGYLEAREWFGKAFAASPDNDEIIARFVESHIMWGDKVNDFRLLEELVLLLDYGLQSKPGSASLARAKSRLFIMLKQPRKAFINAERALKFERESIDNQIAYAQALSFSNGPLAAQMLEKILLRSAYPVYTRRILGDVYFKQGNLANAERVWTEILIESPHSCITCEQLALLYEDIGLYDKAAGMYVRLIKNKDDMVNGPLGLARSLSLAGKKPEKIAEQLETIIEEKKTKMQEEQLGMLFQPDINIQEIS